MLTVKKKKTQTAVGVERLLFLCPLKLTFICLLLPFSNVTFSQSTCSIKLSVTVEAARCQANGIITCQLTDTAGSELEQIRYSYIACDGLDSVMETTAAKLTQFRPGLYNVYVSALCRTHLGMEEEYIIVRDSTIGVHVPDLYTIPTCQTIYNIYTQHNPYGIVPSFACQATGKAQLKIEDGNFPYTVDIWKIDAGDTIFLRQDVFENHQNSGLFANKYDYRNYYTINDLAVGTYIIRFHDGCGYYTPALQVEIPELHSGIYEQAHLLRNSSLNPTNNNIIIFKELLEKNLLADHNDDYYRYQDTTFGPLIEYRFINPTIVEELDTTRWYPLLMQDSGFIYLSDTMAQLSNYGSAWFREILLQFRPRYCSNDFWTYRYTIYPHIHSYDTYSYTILHQEEGESYVDLCGWHIGEKKRVFLKNSVTYSCNYEHPHSSDSLNYRNPYTYTLHGGIPDAATGITYHRYITLPLQYKITNLSADTVICHTNFTENNLLWYLAFNIQPELNGDTIVTEIMDANGCPIHASKSVVQYDTLYQINDSYNTLHQWKCFSEEISACPNGPHQVGVVEHNCNTGYTIVDGIGKVYYYYGDTIRLIESPMDNFYNFTAYADGPQHFHVSKENMNNSADIGYRTYYVNSVAPALYMTDNGLPSGRYVWTISYACDRKDDTLVQNVQFQSAPEQIEKPSYRFIQGCSRLDIIPEAGLYSVNGHTLTTYFQVHSLGSFAHSANSVQKNGTLSIGVPGTYIISMYALPSEDAELLDLSPCYIQDTVIQWDGNTVEFDYLESYVCNHHDTVGFVRVRGKNGSLPYHYKVFSQPDCSGSVLAQNDIGDFDTLPIRADQQLSIEIADACNAHFHSNFRVTDMESIRKCWVEDHLYEATLHEGDTCHLYSIALEGVSFHWTGPNNLNEHTRNHAFPIGEEGAGIYRIEILNTGCATMRDSLRIYVIPANACPEAVDYDGHHYPSVRIDGLCWTTTNLRSHHYGDGRTINAVRSYYAELFPDTAANVETYGHLYDWHAAIDTARMGVTTTGGHLQGICPNGWYLPDEQQYQRLRLHGADELRSPLYWINNSGGNNGTGFSALPAGFYNGTTLRYENMLGETRFWSTKNAGSENLSSILLFYHGCNDARIQPSNAGNGYSIRCILEE